MKYECTSPCKTCPWRTDTPPFLTVERVEEIAYGDAQFSCHNTTTVKGVGNDHPEAQHCAGALILWEKDERPHQMMRISERLGFYDYTKLNMDAPVYDGWEHAIEAHQT